MREAPPCDVDFFTTLAAVLVGVLTSVDFETSVDSVAEALGVLLGETASVMSLVGEFIEVQGTCCIRSG